ncbi:hypothetical protein BH11PLA2_BH11PLA2_14210 [soil metagenome]
MKPEIESAFHQIGETIQRTLADIPAPAGKVYACGFWLFYCDYTVLGPPCFAYNTVGNEKDTKWCPPEWQVDVEDRIVEALNPIYRHVEELMKDESEESWEMLLKYQWGFYSQLCHSLTRDAQTLLKHWQITDDFVCGIFEEREGEDVYYQLIKDSVGEEKAIQLGMLP